MPKNRNADTTVVILIGSKGAGKSTFIDEASEQRKRATHELGSGTVKIQYTPCLHPKTKQPFVLVDTPGFNNDATDARIVLMITSWLEKSYKRITALRIVYVHRISDNRLVESPLQYLQMLASFLGHGRIGSVVLATTMWHTTVNQARAKGRQDELCIEHWREMMSIGCRVAKFEKTVESAWMIIDMTNDTADGIHEFLLERREGGRSPESIDLAERNRSREKKTLLERCKQFLERAMFRIK
ncbi:hypothetical protein L208DRAFT_1401514 [Tricholoma matsutake]|nr:hypothetical protein L208DRAFT_1401514 [Tricholoma matsutake 945]